jgi:hypothetical protein
VDTREVDVRDQARLVRQVQRDGCKRFARGNGANRVPARAGLAECHVQCLAERAAGRLDLRLRAVRSDLEHEVEASVAGEHAKEVVEGGQAGVDADVAGAVHGQARHELRVHASTRSICAPSDRSRSSTRS